MVSNMKEFISCINLLSEKLIDAGEVESAKRLSNVLLISNSTLEILGASRVGLKYLEKNKAFKKIKAAHEIKSLRAFISTYWPGY